jgi:hypothetical protein
VIKSYNVLRKFCAGVAVMGLLAGDAPASGGRLPYLVDEAYRVYAAVFAADLIPDLQSKVVLIRDATLRDQIDENGCPPSKVPLGVPKADEDISAIAEDYDRENHHERILQSRFLLNRPYKLIATTELKKYFPKKKAPDWDSFLRRYPSSRAYLTLSAVGFNPSRDVALVKVRVECGILCGSVQLYRLRKIDGRWQQAKMIGCGLVF